MATFREDNTMLTSRKSLWWWLIMSCCLVSFLAISQTAPAQQRQPAAELIGLVGKAEIKSPGEAQFRPAKLQDKLYPQDQIRTLKDSRAKLFFQDESIIILSEDTTMDIAKFQMKSTDQRESALMKLVNGSVRFIVKKVTAGVTPNFEIQGKTAVMGIRGTDGIMESRSPDRVIFFGGAGSIQLRNLTSGQTLTITPNQWAMTTPAGGFQTGPVTPLMRQQLMPFFRLSQAFVPDSVSSPPPPPALMFLLRQQEIPFLGEPQFSNSSEGRNSFGPGAQGNGGGTVVAPLSVTHQPLIPRR
jgi:hypothetical protein